MIAATPPMGWNSWNTFGKAINETLVKQVADALVQSGLRDAGYVYVNLDDHWQCGRDEHGQPVPYPDKFPGGIKALADYVHQRGLKFGLYSDAGEKTCGGEVGSFGYEAIDARCYAAWGVDYLKYDYCYAPADAATAIQHYTTMGKALRATGRPIVYSICEWGERQPWLWAAEAGGHLWRTTGDIWDHWEGKRDYALGVMDIVDLQVGIADYAGPG
ncbi:MAG TPA: glycoside hydrolase family 27 protein, partial [Aggregatilineales bacterium]|nr:glycoside hydrolase family 27 protein [Aggregatilineales bacterium]